MLRNSGASSSRSLRSPMVRRENAAAFISIASKIRYQGKNVPILPITIKRPASITMP